MEQTAPPPRSLPPGPWRRRTGTAPSRRCAMLIYGLLIRSMHRVLSIRPISRTAQV